MSTAIEINVACGSLNPSSGNIAKNEKTILKLIHDAVLQNIQLLVLPELCLTGYGIEDQFFYQNLIDDAWQALLRIRKSVPASLMVVVGLPIQFENNQLYNACAWINDGNIRAITFKRTLAKKGIHYEPRWFTPWPYGKEATLDIDGQPVSVGDVDCRFLNLNIGIEICEDAWTKTRPLLENDSLDIILNPSASHYALGKQVIRRKLVLDSAKAFQGVYIYANLLGCEAGRIVYDGVCFIAQNGKLIAESERFLFTNEALLLGSISIVLKNNEKSETPITLEKPTLPTNTIAKKITDDREILLAIARGLWDWMMKTKTKGFVISLSGGADSAICAFTVTLSQWLALKTFGRKAYKEKLKMVGINFDEDEAITEDDFFKLAMKEILITVYQASKYSSGQTKQLAYDLASELNTTHHEWNIDDLVDCYKDKVERAIGRALSFEKDDIALQNIQARSRAPGVWMLANIENKLLITTSNFSEAVVGYCTMDGDTAGVLAPIGDLSKTYILHLLSVLGDEGFEYKGSYLEAPSLVHISKQNPSAELRPESQTDERDLMPYEVLDKIKYLSQVKYLEGSTLFTGLLASFSGVYSENELQTWVHRYDKLAKRSQWKRERLAPAFHLEEDSACPKTYRRWPIF